MTNSIIHFHARANASYRDQVRKHLLKTKHKDRQLALARRARALFLDFSEHNWYKCEDCYASYCEHRDVNTEMLNLLKNNNRLAVWFRLRFGR